MIYEVSPNGGTPRPVLSQSTWEIMRLGCSPDGRWISLETQLEGVFLMPAAGGPPHRILSMSIGHTWDGVSRRLYYLNRDPRGGTRILATEMDLERGRPVGEPATLSLGTSSLWELSVARDGLRIAVREEEASRNLTRLPLTPGGDSPAGPEEALSTGRAIDAYPDVSPDNRRIAFVSDQLGHFDEWVLELQTGRRLRLELPGDDRLQVSGVWMPNGNEIVLGRIGIDNGASNWLVAVDGSGARELFERGNATFEGSGWTVQPSPDGKRLLFPELVNGTQQAVTWDLTSKQKVALTDTPGDKYDTVWSPDGGWIAVTALKDGSIQLFRLPAAGGSLQQLTTGYERMRHPFFSRDGKWIYIQPSHRNIFRVRAEGGPLEQVTRFPEAGLFLEEPTISKDGRYLVYSRENGGASIWLLTLEQKKPAS
jgi:Tol biopolymer transport system component